MMSVLQGSGSTLESIIGSRPWTEWLTHWKSFKLSSSSLSGDVFSEAAPVQFYDKFWGKSMADEEQKWRNAQSPSSTPVEGYEPMDVDVSEEDDDLIEGCCFLELDIEDINFSRIWIRAEYIRIYNSLENQRGFNSAPAAVITGQPGIGKSLWIYYALRRRLAERKPVIWYYRKNRYLFVEEGVYKVPDQFHAFRVFVWTLVDSDESKDGVPEYLVMHNTRHFVIYSTSPNAERWSRLHKTVSNETYIMNPWKIKELLRVVDTLPPELKVDRERAIEVFNQFGPTPRLCIDYLIAPRRMKDYEENVEQVISELTTTELRRLFRGARSLTLDPPSHKICLVSRMEGEDVLIVSPITSHIKWRLALHFRTLELREQLRLYVYFSKVPAWRSIAGVFFEGAAQQCIQPGLTLDVIPMVRLSSSPSGHPQWHSSHVFLQNNALEISRQQALPVECKRVTIPKGVPVVEYTKSGPESPIKEKTFYVPESTNQVNLDSFIWMDNFLYIFQFTITEKHKINAGLLTYHLDQYPELPPKSKWCFIFILPLNHELVCPHSQKFEDEGLEPYSAVVDVEKCLLDVDHPLNYPADFIY